jgi:hypothetical protein
MFSYCNIVVYSTISKHEKENGKYGENVNTHKVNYINYD